MQRCVSTYRYKKSVAWVRKYSSCVLTPCPLVVNIRLNYILYRIPKCYYDDYYVDDVDTHVIQNIIMDDFQLFHQEHTRSRNEPPDR